MKRLSTTLMLLLMVLSFSFANKVELEKAKKVAQNFLVQSKDFHGNIDLNLAYNYELIAQSQFVPDIIEKVPLLYVFDIGNEGGIILVSGDDIASPVLGYTFSGSFDIENLPYNFQKWIEGYKKQISFAIENEMEASQAVEDMWRSLIEGDFEFETERRLNPLCTTTWNQTPYYNAMCPGGSVTGCVATAMAQVMKYWNHPAQGTGMHSYNHDVYGTLSVNFGATTYEWSQMPNSISSNNNAVATLNYHCGVSVDMGYSPNESGAWVVEDDSPVCAESAFKNYFGYSNSLHGEKRENYSTTQWVQMMYSDLDAGRPLVYAGFGGGGGHCFVADGYNSGDFFHFNWGWGGSYDGYFHIDALDPGGTGTGGGTGGYNTGHQAIFGMIPETTTSNYDLSLYDNLTVSPGSISMGDAFSVQAVVGNFGANDFNGEFAAFVFDANNNAIDNVSIVSDNLLAGYYNTYTFSTGGMTTLLPGSYTISVYYRTSGDNWIQVGDGSYNNSVALTVQNESDIELYSSWNISCGTTITQGQPFDVIIDIANYGNSTFYGSFDVSLYDLDGYFVETIATLSGAALDPNNFYDDLMFSTYGVSLEPGTYLMAAQHQPEFGSWTLTGSSNYPNPIQVIVMAEGEQADVYEPNDIEGNATNLSVNFVGNNASVLTTGSNSDNGSDYDYYYVNLPSGYDYTITARAHDSYNSGNGQYYTNDILWSFNAGFIWSMAYDDVMFGNITVNNGGMVKFLAAPYFLGETGTYLLDIQIVRTPLGIDDFSVVSDIDIYPNPVKENLNISFSAESTVNSIQIMDISGSKVKVIDNPVKDGGIYTIPVYDIESGTYIVSISTEEKVHHQKFIKTK